MAETAAKAPAKPKRVYVIQNENGEVLNIVSEVANLDFAIIVTGDATEDGVNASIIRASVEKKAPKRDLDELTTLLTN